MQLKTRLAALALLGASVVVTASAVAGAGAAQAAATPSAHAAVLSAPVRVAAAPRTVAPDIFETVCNTYANSADFYMHWTPNCAEFLKPGSTPVELLNVYQVNTQLWAGHFEYDYNGFEYRQDFLPWQVIKYSVNITVVSITITNNPV